MNAQPIQVQPYSIDLSALVPRSVASFYSNLITRPTGRALRVGIEAQIGELGACCLSVLDFTQVIILDYSCADEAVAKLVHRYRGDDRPADVYFLASGLGEQHRDPIEAVLARYRLILAAEVEGTGAHLLGETDADERAAWGALQRLGRAGTTQIADATGTTERRTRDTLDTLARRRVLIRQGGDGWVALGALVGR
jgi:hypothetical protein